MADKLFEELVREQLVSLRMKPAESVWPVIEKELHKEKKRRWLIWFFLTGISAVSAFGIYKYVHSDKNEISNTNNIISSNSKSPATDIVKANKETVLSSDVKTEKINPVDKRQTENDIEINSGKENKGTINKKTSDHALQLYKTGNKLLVQQNKQPVLDNKANTDAQIHESNSQKKGVSEKNTISDTTASISNEISNNNTIVSNKFSDSTIAETKSQTQQINPTQDSSYSIIVKKTRQNKEWQWSIAPFAGSVQALEKLFGHSATVASFQSSNAIPSAPSNSPVVKSAAAFGFSIQASKEISKNQSISFSGGYSLFQTNINVGNKVDSVALGSLNYVSAFNNTRNVTYYSSYYYSTGNNNYTNRYHFIQLGIDWYAGFKLFRTIPMRWQLGTGIDLLFASNGLHYDDSKGKLYNNNSLYAKTQWFGSTGFDVAIGKKQLLYIGPHIQYNFTRLSPETSTPQHFFLSSLRVTFVLSKKKKMQR